MNNDTGGGVSEPSDDVNVNEDEDEDEDDENQLIPTKER